jgi:hypothetical protein
MRALWILAALALSGEQASVRLGYDQIASAVFCRMAG